MARSARAVSGVPEGGPSTPSARGGGTTCGGGGGGAEAGLPPPDVTSRLPRAYQGLPRPQPKSASLPFSLSSDQAVPSCTLAACLARPLPQPWSPLSPARTWPARLYGPSPRAHFSLLSRGSSSHLIFNVEESGGLYVGN